LFGRLVWTKNHKKYRGARPKYQAYKKLCQKSALDGIFNAV